MSSGGRPKLPKKILNYFEVNFKMPIKKPDEDTMIAELYIVSMGKSMLHDSGYPYNLILGVDEERNLYFLGYHDVIHFEKISGMDNVRMDNIMQNLFRIIFGEPVRVSYYGMDSCYIFGSVVRC